MTKLTGPVPLRYNIMLSGHIRKPVYPSSDESMMYIVAVGCWCGPQDPVRSLTLTDP